MVRDVPWSGGRARDPRNGYLPMMGEEGFFLFVFQGPVS